MVVVFFVDGVIALPLGSLTGSAGRGSLSWWDLPSLDWSEFTVISGEPVEWRLGCGECFGFELLVEFAMNFADVGSAGWEKEVFRESVGTG